ncbi:MAG TPA: hemolysin family protein [Spirochaetota bacterium]|nr:hemolysin family protein [Spirochaetota bacterium]
MEPDQPNQNIRTFSIKKYLSRLIEKSRRRSSAGKGNNGDESTYGVSSWEELESTKQDMIKGVINLSSQNVREIMIPRIDVVAVDVSVSMKDVAEVITDAGHSRIPVFKGTIDNIVGILHVKDLLNFLVDKPKKFNLKKILRKPYFIPETMPLDDLLLEFKKRSLHMAIAVDEYGGFGGIVTLEDILEEIVGEISDEFDTEELPELEKIGKNSWDVDSRMPLADFSEEMGISLPVDEFDTIGGFVFDIFGKIPVKDECVKYNDISFKIKDIDGTRINRILVTLPPRSRDGK